MKCEKCNNEAKYNSPQFLCTGCWFDWFHEDYVKEGFYTEEEYNYEKTKFTEKKDQCSTQ